MGIYKLYVYVYSDFNCWLVIYWKSTIDFQLDYITDFLKMMVKVKVEISCLIDYLFLHSGTWFEPTINCFSISILKFFLIPITSVFSEVSTLVFLIRGAVQWEMADHWVNNWMCIMVPYCSWGHRTGTCWVTTKCVYYQWATHWKNILSMCYNWIITEDIIVNPSLLQLILLLLIFFF
jgi:hypothetical protein